jgi:hypothetical protein
MVSIDGFIDYQRREYCKDVKCPIQLLLNQEEPKSAKYEEIRGICSKNCVHSTYEFHHWLDDHGYLIVRKP